MSKALVALVLGGVVGAASTVFLPGFIVVGQGPPAADGSAMVGTIAAFGGVYNEAMSPTWLFCNGQSLRRRDYPELFSAIGTAWGQGDQPGATFNLPDLRGRFVRGLASGTTDRDPDAALREAFNGGNAGDKVGSLQRDQFQAHYHEAGMPDGSGRHGHPVEINRGAILGTNGSRDCDEGDQKYNGDPEYGSLSASIDNNSGGHSHPVEVKTPTSSPDSGTSGLRFGKETRPVNAYVSWIIKAK